MPHTDRGLPFAPRSQTSYLAAVAVEPARQRKTDHYLRCLQEYGPLCDHAAADLLKVPLSSICSIRNGVKDRLVKDGTARSPYGKRVDCWRLAH